MAGQAPVGRTVAIGCGDAGTARRISHPDRLSNREGNDMSSRRQIAMCLIAVAVAFIAVASIPAFGEDIDAYDRIASLKRDISTLNQLNGLHLTDVQQSAILEEARNAQALRDRYKLQYSHATAKAEESFLELKKQLIDVQTPQPKDVESRAKRQQAELKRIHGSYIRELARIEERVLDTLTAGQAEIIEDFKPCLIPPKNLRNPARAGQANDHGKFERLLSRSRQWPDDAYDRRSEKFLDKYISKIEEKHGPMTSKEVAAEKERIRAIVEESRALSDVDFELSKQELAARIDNNGHPGPPKGNTLVSQGKRPGKITRFLLSKEAIPLLEERVQLAGAPSHLAANRLDSITPAEDCRTQCTAKPQE